MDARIRPSRLTRFALALLALVVSEGLVRLALSFPPVAERLATNDDLSYRRAWVERRRAAAGLAELDVHDPQLGWRTRADLSISPIWNGKTLTTNGQGFRSHRNYDLPKAPGTIRVLAVGDSYTFGEEVGDSEVWTRLLDDACPQIEVFNVGVHGYGHDQMLLLLRRLGPKYRPDVVLLGYLKTDMYRNLLRFRDFAKPGFRLSGGRLVLEGTPVPTPEAVLEGDRWRPRLVDFASIVAVRVQNLVGIRSWRKRRLTTALLTELAQEARQLGAKPLFAYFPAGAEFRDPERNRRDEAFFWRLCEGIEGVVCTSVSKPLLAAASRSGGECCEVPSGYHWNARGHELAASSLLGALVAAGVAPGCAP